MDKIINGRLLAEKHQDLLRERIKELSRTPSVVSILIGNDKSSLKYSEMKQKKAEELGIEFEINQVSDTISYKEVENFIKKLNSNENISGIMLQLPIPFDRETTQKLLDIIDPNKDIDGLRTNSKFIPATVRGVISILKSVNVIASEARQSTRMDRHDETSRDDDSGSRVRPGMTDKKKIVVVGGVRGKVGISLVKALQEQGENVEGVSRDDPELSEKTRQADILISSTGASELIKPNMIKEGVVLIDIGLGDFDPECYLKAARYTPKIGGVGPMTVISLMENIVDTVEFG